MLYMVEEVHYICWGKNNMCFGRSVLSGNYRSLYITKYVVYKIKCMKTLMSIIKSDFSAGFNGEGNTT